MPLQVCDGTAFDTGYLCQNKLTFGFKLGRRPLLQSRVRIGVGRRRGRGGGGGGNRPASLPCFLSCTDSVFDTLQSNHHLICTAAAVNFSGHDLRRDIHLLVRRVPGGARQNSSFANRLGESKLQRDGEAHSLHIRTLYGRLETKSFPHYFFTLRCLHIASARWSVAQCSFGGDA
jgi:hypothetical protein